MKRRMLGLVSGTAFLVLTVAGPAVAAPQPRIHENGTVTYANAYIEECSRRTCTFTGVSASVEQGTGDVTVCYDQYGSRSGTSWCEPVDSSALTFSGDTATLAPTTLNVETCNRRGCTTEQIVVSFEVATTGPTTSYAYSNYYEYPDGCVERYSVRGESAPADGTFTVDGKTYDANGGSIGKDTYRFSSTCMFEA